MFGTTETPAQALQTSRTLLAESGKDAPFASLAYANLVVFSALLFCLAGLSPFSAIAYVFFAFGLLILTALGGRFLQRFRSSKTAGPFAVSGYILNELALASILVFDYFAPERADGFTAIVIVASISFVSVPLFARFTKSFLLIKFGVVLLCCLYAMTTPLNRFGTAVALAALLIALLLMISIGYWIIRRRREEVRLRYELTRLNELAADQNKRLNQALAQSEADFDLRQRLLSYIGHDLRQPISAAGYILREMSQKQSTVKRQSLVDDMQECVQSAGRMIEDIVQITHYDNPEIEAFAESVNVDQILKQVESEYAKSALNSGAYLRRVKTSVQIDFDPVLLTRILRNLVRNAIKHADAKDVLIGVRHRESQCEIWVVDNGKGLEATAQISSPQRAGERTGLGLGLKISEQLATACGANLIIESAKGKGTCCRLQIPCTLIL
jgi:signal transduction histidine kinase